MLDPVLSLRRFVKLAPSAEARIVFVTGAADDRQTAVAIAERFGLSRDNIRQVRARLIRKLRARLEPLLNARPADR